MQPAAAGPDLRRVRDLALAALVLSEPPRPAPSPRSQGFFVRVLNFLAFTVLQSIAATGCLRPDESGDSFTVAISDRVACASCTIVVGEPQVLYTPTDSGIDLPLAVRQDSQGRYWVIPAGQVPLGFDSLGTLFQPLGRSGRGPGEYLRPLDVLAIPGDSLAVVDPGNRRLTIVDQRLEYSRSVAIPFSLSAIRVASWPDSVIVSARFPRDGEETALLHRLSIGQSEVGVAESFHQGLHQAALSHPVTKHVFTQISGGSWWSAWINLYDVTLREADGTILKTLERRPSWFPRVSPETYDWRNEPPPPHIAGLEIDSDGLLWVLVLVARSTWKEAWVEVSPNSPEAIARPELLYSTIVEVIDPTSNEIIAVQPLDTYVVNSLPGPRIATFDQDPGGETRISIRTLSVRGR